MKKRQLGRSKLEAVPLAFGGNVFGWTIDEPTSFRLLDNFIDAGFDLIDTADIYSTWVPGNTGGESETIIGRWMKEKGNRHDVIIATKVGLDMGPNQKGLSRKYIMEAVDDSLRRLQTDYIDLYQSHQDDPDTPLAETLTAFGDLVSQGKVRAIGASNYTGERLAEALEVSERLGLPRYETIQPHYNLYDREPYEATIEPLCMEKELGVLPYYALASGFLTGKYRSEADLSKSPRGKDNQKFLNERGYRILEALDEVAAEHDSTPAEVSIAWLASRPCISAPIASATNVEQLNELIAATQLQLKPEAVERLNEASS
ncbi:MAG TPA: aldo/keto reductase [Pyrinomonadaceae bacterium]|jgi:aryl-alcohol dehydrogenase-like predicted oxidoreductase|nr:aldo/keto reductase [Pyrinomonadaceae bacterium]